MKQTLIALTLAMIGGSVCAHGKESHAPLKQEQKPWGIAAAAKTKARSVEIEMLDSMRFVPDRIQVRQGETLRLVLKNSGQMLHELVIGTQQELDAHAALMQKFPNMEHDEPYMSHVPAGKAGELRWTFNRAGEFDFACLIPGHYQAGMRGKIVVHKR